eukprot:11983597-Prorocentrum_lima.AAC.1
MTLGFETKGDIQIGSLFRNNAAKSFHGVRKNQQQKRESRVEARLEQQAEYYCNRGTQNPDLQTPK